MELIIIIWNLPNISRFAILLKNDLTGAHLVTAFIL